MSALPQPADWRAGFVSVLPNVTTHAKIGFATCRQPIKGRRGPGSDRLGLRQLPAAGGAGTAPRGQADHAGHVCRELRQQRPSRWRQTGRRPRCPFPRRPVPPPLQDLQHRPVRHGCWRMAAVGDLADHRKDPIPDTVCFRIDFARWLRTLTRRDRRIIAAFTSGEGTTAVAGRFSITAGRVSQLSADLRAALAQFPGLEAAAS